MNIKLRQKYQSGGEILTTTFTPITVNDSSTPAALPTASSSATAAKSSTSTSGQITDKDLMSMVKEIDGLPSDMNAIINNISKLYQFADMPGASSASLNTKYLQALNSVKLASFNKKQYDEAKKIVDKNGGLNEVAIDSNGLIVVQNNKGKIERISLEKYRKGKDKYMPLSNSELLNIRAYSSPMDNSMLEIVQNGVGMDAVNKYINSVISNMGSSKNTIDGYTQKHTTNQGSIQQGFSILQEVANNGSDISGGLDGLFKSKVITETQKNQATKALKYLYTTLPDNMKTYLEFRAGSKEGAQELLQDTVLGRTKDSKEITTDYVLDANGQKPGAKTSGSSKSSGGTSEDFDADDTGDSDDKSNPVLNIQKGTGGTKTNFKLNKGTQAEFSADGVNYYSFVDTNGKTIQDTTLSNMLAESGIQSIIDKTSISFGNQILDSDSINNVVYRNNGGTRVILPCERVDGKVVPKFDILDKFNQVIDKVNSECTEDTPAKQRQQLTAKYLQEAGLGDLCKPNGSYDLNKICPFLVTDGYTTSKAFKKDDSNDMITETEDENTLKFIEQILSPDDKHQYKIDTFSWYNPADWFGYEKVYKGTVYIPIVSQNQLQAITGYGDQVKLPTAKIKEAAYNRFERLKNVKQTSSDVL